MDIYNTNTSTTWNANTQLPSHLINYALNSSASVGQFLKLIQEMKNWDTKQLEAFYNKHPGLRPD